MIITTWNGKSFDTDKDLTEAERHIVQKLFAWESLVASLEQFREKKNDFLVKGWNNMGPVPESSALRAIIQDIEKKIMTRLKTEQP
ncbi:MAG: hypothetical protein R6T98_15420 [Desulfatiglandales bacterium]